MLRNYLKIGWRKAKKNRSFTLISLISLVLGITIFYAISLWVQDEYSYDTAYPHVEEIFRIQSNLTLTDGTTSELQTVGWPVGITIERNYAEVEALTYLRGWNPVISIKDTKFYDEALMADEEFFDVFGYELLQGNKKTALTEPYSIVLTEKTKQRYFGNSEAVGEVLMVNDTVPYKVTGVLKNLESPSHLQFDMIRSFSSHCAEYPESCERQFSSGWYDVNVYNYVKVKPNTDKGAFADKIKNLVAQFGKEAVEQTGFETQLSLVPVADIYLKSGMPTVYGTVGNIKSVKLFFAVGLFILVLACLNFINLTTASSMERAKEIGIKKVLGGKRKSLIYQFLTEASLLCIIAAIASLALILLGLDFFNLFTGKSFGVADILNVQSLSLLLLILLILIPFAGFYPAWVMSSFKPVRVLKGSCAHSLSGNNLRKGLVIFQFVVSIAFIMGTIVVNQQMNYMQNVELGFDRENILLVDAEKVPWSVRHSKAELLKQRLITQNGFTNATAATAIPGRTGWGGQFAYPEGRTKEENVIVEYIPVDFNYIETLGLELVAGRNFLEGSEMDLEQGLIINEIAVKNFGWKSNEDAIGKSLATSGKEGKVIGVLKDYHQHGLQSKINSVVLGVASFVRLYAVRYENIQGQEAITNLTRVWEEVFPDYPLEFSFMDEVIQKQYEKEQKLAEFFSFATILSIVIACLGLLGLSIFTAQRRIKEIGVRKVLGASATNIVLLLSKEFLQLVFIAIMIAIPIAWYYMDSWLQDFAYKINLSWWTFIVAGISGLSIAFFTMAFQSIKAAISNPVESLRTE